MKARLSREALSEIEEAERYYESKRLGLGGEFVTEVGQMLERIAVQPRSFPFFDRIADIRIATLQRFPYRLPFILMADGIRILAVAHTSRRPGYWRRRNM